MSAAWRWNSPVQANATRFLAELEAQFAAQTILEQRGGV